MMPAAGRHAHDAYLPTAARTRRRDASRHAHVRRERMALRANSACLRAARRALRNRAVRFAEGARGGKVRPAAALEQEVLAAARAGGFLSGYRHAFVDEVRARWRARAA